jgi:hypothetical protein
MLSNMGFPLLSLCKRMMRQILWPAPLDHILSPFPLHNHLVGEPTGLGQDQNIERVTQVLVVYNRIFQGIFALQRHAASRPLVEEEITHGKRVFVVDRKISVLLWAAVELCIPEFHAGLLWRKTHRVTAGFARRILPEWRVGEALVEAGVPEDSKGERGEKACFLFLIQSVGGSDGVIVVGKVVVGEIWF